MAVKKVADEVEQAVETKDLWEQMVTIRLPKAQNGEPNYVIASLNGRVFKIQRNVKVEVPLPIAEVLENSAMAEEEAERYIDSLPNA